MKLQHLSANCTALTSKKTLIYVEQQNQYASDTYVTHVTIYVFKMIVESTVTVFLSRIKRWVFVKGKCCILFWDEKFYVGCR